MSIRYYAALSALSFLLTFLYVIRWHRRLDVHMTAIFLLMPIVNLAFFLMYRYDTADAATVALKIVYIGGCYLPWLTFMCMTGLCRIHVSRLLRSLSFLLCSALYMGVLTIGSYPYFYKSLTIGHVGGNPVMLKEYGPLHSVFYVCVALMLIVNVATILYCLVRKRQVSRTVLYLLSLPILISIVGFLFNHLLIGTGYEIVPASYVLAQSVYLFIAHRMALYNASDMVIASMVQSGVTGFITVDFKYRYLGSNETAKRILPALRSLTVDRPILREEALRDNLLLWLKGYEEGKPEKFLHTCTLPGEPPEDKIYTVHVSDLYDGRKRRGYQIYLEDDTQDQKYIALLDNYNAELEREVSAKTARILDMHDRLILGMATMVESRDNSTGGHIRRTSEGVRILVEELKKDELLPESFCRNIIKAAPMHDLGKIAVDDAILRKPGRFTKDEFEKMKTHAAEGARIVHAILEDTDDEDFCRIAENVAHYHHERVDGTGYPDGLKGDEIPREARIMAIADVYDALVSKRVYKDSCSFEEADRIIMDGMGTHFDARLKPVYEAARPRLEAYYTAERS